MAPKVTAKGSDRAGGVLPINAATRAAATNKPISRLKLEIRRLPPGLTLSEFEEVLGEEWKLGKGKVDWREYRQGKLKALGKVPEQSRCYVHLANETLVKEFEQRFLSVVFHDKAGTHKHAELKNLPPTLGFAPSQRTPLQVKQRADNRQGTIDQDPEFIQFLEAETQPLGRPSALLEREGKEQEVVKTTPLIQDLRERKALRAKVAAEKAEKKKVEDGGKKVGAGHGRSGSKDVGVGKGDVKITQQKVEQAAKEAAKVLNKQAAATKQQQGVAGQATSAKGAAPSAKSKKAAPSPRQQNATLAQSPAATQPAASPGPASPAPDRRPPGQRQRGNADGIKKMLQKDLGIRPKVATTDSPTSSPKPSTAAPATVAGTSAPAPTSANPTSALTPAVTKTIPAAKPLPTPAASTTKAYLKHANPSQGMTEMLILRSLSEFGEVTNVTIDPRKGTAIANFKDNEGLKKAMAARRVPVASGAVEVLEYREGSVRGVVGTSGRGRGGFRGGRGGARGGANSAASSAGGSASGTPAPPSAPAA